MLLLLSRQGNWGLEAVSHCTQFMLPVTGGGGRVQNANMQLDCRAGFHSSSSLEPRTLSIIFIQSFPFVLITLARNYWLLNRAPRSLSGVSRLPGTGPWWVCLLTPKAREESHSGTQAGFS